MIAIDLKCMRVVGATAGIVGLFVVPMPAQAASSVQKSNTDLVVTADGANDTITVQGSGPNLYSVSDPTGVTAGTGCVPAGTTEALCTDLTSSTSIYAIYVYGNDGNDHITFQASGGVGGSLPPTYADGGSGDDYITGASQADGGDGSDSITGSNFAPQYSYLAGGPGNDSLYAGAQHYLYGDRCCSATDDVGAPDSDLLVATNGADRLYGQGGDDEIDAYDGNDEIYGGTGNDKLYASYGEDYVDAGDGNDKLWVLGDDASDDYECGAGVDIAYVDIGLDYSNAPAACETVAGHL